MDLTAIFRQMPPKAAERARTILSNPVNWIEIDQRLVSERNKEPGDLTGYDCPDCLNRGFFWRVRENGERYVEECACGVKRRNLRHLQESGLSELVQRYTFDAWQCREKWQQGVLSMAREFAAHPDGWFYLAGSPGTGKTHLCTAICGELMERGFPVRYMLWRDVSVRAKGLVTDDAAYQKLIDPFKRVRVLYIDDLFKSGAAPTTADINLAFELLNARYNDERNITLISSEWTAQRLIDIDEGLGSRVYQRSKRFYADLSQRRNFRLTPQKPQI